MRTCRPITRRDRKPRTLAQSVGAIIASLAAVCSSMPAAAQDFPSRPVKAIVPYAPGGSGDILMRLLGNKLSSMWGQQVVVENKPGGGGLIGTELAVRSPPDGYTIYVASDGPITVAPSLYKSVPYDWKRDLAPISMMAVGYQILLVNPQLPVKTVAEYVALARQKPGALNYGSIGIGSAPHMGAEIFKAAARIDVTHVPYAGSTAQAVTSLIGGEVSMVMIGTSPVIGQLQAGKLRGLAVTAPQRMSGLPDVPTFTEAGMPEVDMKVWFGLMVPGGTPPAIVDKLHADIVKALADPEHKAAVQARGFEAVSSSSKELAEFLDRDHRRMRDVITSIRLLPQ